MSGAKRVAVVMGSRSDEDFMEPALQQLESLRIGFDKKFISAHRDLEELIQYVEKAQSEGVEVFVAAAGLSAALPGVVASRTTKPVIGVPVPAGELRGVDALLSMVQMPGGIPVAAVGIGSQGPKNAALLAAQILALHDSDLARRIGDQRRRSKKG